VKRDPLKPSDIKERDQPALEPPDIRGVKRDPLKPSDIKERDPLKPSDIKERDQPALEGVKRKQPELEGVKGDQPAPLSRESKGTDSPATSSTAADREGSLADNGTPGGTRPPGKNVPPGNSLVGETSFELTPHQRKFKGSLWEHTEEVVGRKLEQETGLTVEPGSVEVRMKGGTRSVPTEGAKFLSDPIPSGRKALPIDRKILLKEPIITNPDVLNPEAYDYLVSARPDYLYLTPEQLEVFEVTVDSRFMIKPQEPGMRVTGKTARRLGYSHKHEQISKMEYLIRRYPDHSIVYNIQTIGDVPAEVQTVLRTEVEKARNLLKKLGGKGSVSVIVRADRTFVF
jgi:hypothetical protein